MAPGGSPDRNSIATWPRWYTIGRPAALLLVALGISGSVRAEGWQFDAVAATDDVLRGLSLTGGRPSFGVGGAYYAESGLFAGASVATVKPVPGEAGAGLAIGELGYAHLGMSDWGTQYMWSHYAYTVSRLSQFDFDDFRVTESFRNVLFLSIGGSPHAEMVDATGKVASGPVMSTDGVARVQLAHGWTANAGVGYFALQRLFHNGFVYCSAGLTWQFRSLQFDAALIGTSPDAKRHYGSAASNRAIADVVYHF